MTTTSTNARCGCDAPAQAIRGAEAAETWFRAPVDVIETEEGVIVRADVPGVSPDQVGIHITGDTMELHAPISRPIPNDSRAFLAEYEVGDWKRVLRLAPTIDPDGITARCTNGVLEVRLPKRQEAQRRRIRVNEN